MIKIVVCIILTLLLAYLGYGIEKYYINRLKTTLEYKKFIIFAERETSFLKTNVLDLVNKFPFEIKDLKELLLSSVEGENAGEVKNISKELKGEIVTFINELCKSDYSKIKMVLKNAYDKCEGLIAIAEKEKSQKGELSRKLIILLGIGIIIILL